ncbi:hypothetical protein KR200_007218, partial [Drosophila serrata]
KSKKSILVGYEANGYRLWGAINSKFIVARDVVVDETNMVISRAIKCESFPNDSKENNSFPNDSTENEKILNESKESENILNESRECEEEKFPNESRKRKQFDPLNENKEDLDGIDNNRNDAVTNRRSERLQKKPYISYKEDD